MAEFHIEAASVADVPTILQMIKALAEYENLADAVVATEDGLRTALFGPRPAAEAVLGFVGHEPVGFALFFHSFSTFLGAAGLYLEDLFVRPESRGRGYGGRLLSHLAGVAVARGCHGIEWAVLDWNEPALGFYRRAGAVALENWRLFRLTGDALVGLAERAGGAR